MSHGQPLRSLLAPLQPLPEDGEETVEVANHNPPVTSAGAVQEPTLLLPVIDRPRTYICPGEKHAIPRSVHLARLAAFYPNCRTCDHRHDTGQLPRSKVGRLEQSARRVAVTSPFCGDGIRGAYLNHLTQKTAGRIAAAVAHILWADRPLIGRTATPEADDLLLPRRGGPMVVIGQDSRSSSPDICVGVSASLRRMGCEVIDVGRVTGPCLTFAVEHLQAAAGIYVTGSGCPDSWTGLDLIGQGGIPWSMGGMLPEIERCSRMEIPRPTRLGGTQRYFDAALPYRASLLKHYQELRPMRLSCICPEQAVLDAVRPLFDGLPCELIPHLCDRHQPASGATESISPAVVQAAMNESSADYGVALDESGREITLIGGDRRPIPFTDLLRRLLAQWTSAQDSQTIMVGPGGDDEIRPVLTSLGIVVVETGDGAETMARGMQEGGATLGIQSGGRIWFRDPFPRCDALLTLGRLLQSLARESA